MRPIRLFIAIEFPASLQERLEEVSRDLARSGVDVRWVAPENLHVTLHFLGEVSANKVSELKVAMEEGAKGVGRFLLSVGGIGVFPDWRNPRVIWVGIERGKEEIIRLYEGLSVSLRRVDSAFLAEERDFKAHITLGRFRNEGRRRGPKSPDKDLRLERLKEIAHIYDGKEVGLFYVEKVSLIRSQLTPSGPIYSLISSTHL